MRRALALAVWMVAAQAAPSFDDWLDAAPGRRAEAVAFERYLEKSGVDGVLPADQLLRNATSWHSCRLAYPWSMPPRPLWPHVVPTIRFIRDVVIPGIGPVAVESGYRDPVLNRCAHGAGQSAHALYYALDLVPARPVTRRDLIATVCALHAQKGKAFRVGLGFYGGVRFHIDTKLYRRWGSDNHGTSSPCAMVTP